MRRDPAILLLAIGETFIWASIYYVFPALLLRWEQDLGWTKAELTAAITMAVLVSAIASPMTGRIIDRGHGAPLVGLSALLGGVCLVLLSGVTELWQFYAVWLLMGVSMAGCLYEPCFALVTRSRGINAKRGIILITLVAGFAGTISFPAVYSLSEAFGWRDALRMIAALVILIVAPMLWLGVRLLEAKGRVQPKQTGHAAPSSKAFLKRPEFWFLAIGFSCLALAHGGALHHLLSLLDENGVSSEVAVLAASFIGPMQVAGRLAMMASERYLTHHALALVAFSLMAASVALLLFSAASPVFLSGFVILFGSAWGTVSILRPLLAREILGDTDFGVKSGALALPFLAGSALAPFLGSLIWKLGGYDLMLTALIAVIAIGFALYWNAHRLSDTG